MRKLQPPCRPSLSQQPPSKLNPLPPAERGGGGAHYDDIKIGDECFNIKSNAATCRTYTHAVQLVKGPVSLRCGHEMF